jgi:hypothetical protein
VELGASAMATAKLAVDQPEKVDDTPYRPQRWDNEPHGPCRAQSASRRPACASLGVRGQRGQASPRSSAHAMGTRLHFELGRTASARLQKSAQDSLRAVGPIETDERDGILCRIALFDCGDKHRYLWPVPAAVLG